MFTPVTGIQSAKEITLNGVSGDYVLGQPVPGYVSSWILHVKGTGAAGSFVPKLIVSGADALGADPIAPIYWSVAAEAMIAATTAVSADGIYGVACDGCDLVLTYTSDTGSMLVVAYPVVG
jgi:hypothetical protein